MRGFLSSVLALTSLLSPNLKEETNKKNKKKQKKTNKNKSVFLDIHKGSTYGHQRQETLLKSEKRNNIYKQVFEVFPRDCCPKAGWGSGGRLESSSRGWGGGGVWEGGVG